MYLHTCGESIKHLIGLHPPSPYVISVLYNKDVYPTYFIV